MKSLEFYAGVKRIPSYHNGPGADYIEIDASKPLARYVYLANYKDLTKTGTAFAVTKALIIVCGLEKMVP